MINKILSILPPAYDYFHVAWDSTQIKTLENLMHRLLLEEERINAREKENVAEGSAPTGRGMNKGKGSSTNVCFNCGKSDHWKKECRAKKSNNFEGQQKSKSKFCVYCKKRGHLKQDCKFKKTKEGKGKDGEEEMQPRISLIATQDQDWKSNDDWNLDSGASDHISMIQTILLPM